MSEPGRPTVYLHIGAPKTGTTYLQQVVFQNRAALRRNGLLYPGRSPRAHFLASQDLRNWRFQGYEDPEMAGAWNRLVAEARKFPGRTLISHESLGSAAKAHVDRAMEDLGFAEVHLVFTARDMARQLPAAWQERIRNRGTTTYAEFLAEIRREPLSGPGRRFWEMHGIVRILARWSRGIPPERVHIVTVPPSGSDPTLLWQRFAGVLGVDPAEYATKVKSGANSSLGAAEIAVLRQLNETIADVDIPWPLYADMFKRGLAPRLGSRKGERVELPQDVYDWSVEWSHKTVDALREAGYDVAGDLKDLVPSMRTTGLDPDSIPGDQQAEVAVAAMASLVKMLMLERGKRKAITASSETAPARAWARANAAARRVEWPEFVRRGYRKVQARRSSN